MKLQQTGIVTPMVLTETVGALTDGENGRPVFIQLQAGSVVNVERSSTRAGMVQVLRRGVRYHVFACDLNRRSRPSSPSSVAFPAFATYEVDTRAFAKTQYPKRSRHTVHIDTGAPVQSRFATLVITRDITAYRLGAGARRVCQLAAGSTIVALGEISTGLVEVDFIGGRVAVRESDLATLTVSTRGSKTVFPGPSR